MLHVGIFLGPHQDFFFALHKIHFHVQLAPHFLDFVKSEKEVLVWAEENPDVKPSLIIVDLNSTSTKPLSIIAKLKAKFKKSTSVLGFVSHVQGDLKLKAQEAGCDAVMPRSAFSQNLPNLLRRHAATEEAEDHFNRA